MENLVYFVTSKTRKNTDKTFFRNVYNRFMRYFRLKRFKIPCNPRTLLTLSSILACPSLQKKILQDLTSFLRDDVSYSRNSTIASVARGIWKQKLKNHDCKYLFFRTQSEMWHSFTYYWILFHWLRNVSRVAKFLDFLFVDTSTYYRRYGVSLISYRELARTTVRFCIHYHQYERNSISYKQGGPPHSPLFFFDQWRTYSK